MPETKMATRRGNRRGGSMLKSTRSGHRARHSRVCQAQEHTGDNGTHQCCQYRMCKGECTTKCHCLRD
ncbi:hypothetical protein PAHAL_4G070900 [Panicum hallii]|uniref:Uncharacterized protein n=1 Tax=Panicum hallii TaxID=206008 RepID=A0A2T8JC28_9POAL|nr:hypothetical protein PAHAL_4G070900 [Panicum hallii]